MTEEQKNFLFQLDVVLEGEQNHLNWPMMPENVRNIIQGQLGTCRKAIRQVVSGEYFLTLADRVAMVPIDEALKFFESEIPVWEKTAQMPYVTKGMKVKYMALINCLKRRHQDYSDKKEQGEKWINKMDFLSEVEKLYKDVFEKE